MEPSWTEVLAAWSTLATAVFTALLVILAVIGWQTAKATLDASRQASAAAEAANEQARLDSIEQTRPYVYVEVVPGLAGIETFDIRISNTGRSAARELTLDAEPWPDQLDDVGQAVRDLFRTPRTLPPGCSIRAFWRLAGQFADGSTQAGMGTATRVSVRYFGSDPSQVAYVDHFEAMVDNAGLWPVPEAGPNPDGLSGDARKFYVLGQAMIRRVGELGR